MFRDLIRIGLWHGTDRAGLMPAAARAEVSEVASPRVETGDERPQIAARHEDLGTVTAEFFEYNVDGKNVVRSWDSYRVPGGQL